MATTEQTKMPGHEFFWATDLSAARMAEISAWIGTLDAFALGCLEDVLRDVRHAAEHDCTENVGSRAGFADPPPRGRQGNRPSEDET